MNHALQIDEVVEVIAQNLVVDKLGNPDIKALTSLALVCKAFYEPVMSVSWRTVRLVKRLLHIFPPDVVSFERDSGSWKILRHPTIVEWDQFKSYTRRVKALNWIVCANERVPLPSELSFLGIMKTHFGDEPAFPNLSSLDCDRHSIPQFEYWTLFAHPQLTSLATSDWFCPNAGYLPTDLQISFASHYLAPNIQEICLDASFQLGFQAIKILGDLRNLRKLRAAVDSELNLRQLQGLSSAAFSSLEEMDLFVLPNDGYVDGCSIATALLSCISSPNLRSISVDCIGTVPTFRTLSSLLSTIATFRATLASTHLNIRPMATCTSASPGALADPFPLRPIIGLLETITQTLITLDLSAVPLSVSAEDLFRVLDSCNNLEALHLGEKHRRTRSTVNAIDLATVRKMAPQLKWLGTRVVRGVNMQAALEDVKSKVEAEDWKHSLSGFCFGFDVEGVVPEATPFVNACFPGASLSFYTLLKYWL